MDEHFTPLTDEPALSALVERSQREPVLLFKHDPVCSISIVAYHELRHLDDPIPLIDVTRSGSISRLVAAQTGVVRLQRRIWSGSRPAFAASLRTAA